MSIEKVKELLKQLQQELKNTQNVSDDDTKIQLQEMDDNIDQILTVENLQHQDVYDGIMQMEYGFLTKYPIASGIMRDLVDMLSKLGI